MEACIRELGAAGVEDTLLGRATLKLARRIETATSDTGSGFASLVRELRATLAAATADVAAVADPLDDLTRKRAERIASSG